MKQVYFIGISGIGMSAVALFASDSGYKVIGSTDKDNDRVKMLRQQGIHVYIGHNKKNILTNDVDAIVFTSAISDENPELLEAKKRNLTIMSRLDFLKRLIVESKKNLIGITGTDGKTSTTAMISHITIRCGMDPTVILGGIHKDLEFGNYRRGTGPLVAEIDESDGYFRTLSAKIGVLTNLRGDHLEHYKDDLEQYKQSIMTFIKNAEISVVPDDIDEMPENSVAFCPSMYDKYDVLNERIRDIYTKVNLICAVKTCELLGIKPSDSISMLKDFENVDRRMTLRLKRDNLTIIDDYAHTPNEISFSIQSVNNRYKGKRLIVVFEAHRYTRLKRDMKMFAQALASPLIDRVIITPVYSAYETEQPEIFERFLEFVRKNNVQYDYVEGPEEIVKIIDSLKTPDYVVLMMGAGKSSDYSKIVSDICTKKELFFT